MLLNITRFLPQPLLGLDIQDDEIRLLQLQRIHKKHRIKQTLTANLPPGAVINREIKKADIVTNHLQELVQNHHLQEREVAIALPTHCIVSKRITVTKGQNETELEAEIISHLNHCFPQIKENVFYDYVIVSSHDPIQNDIILVASLFTHLNIPVTAIQNAGLRVYVVDVDQYALNRAKHLIEKENVKIEEKWLISCGLALRRSEL